MGAKYFFLDQLKARFLAKTISITYPENEGELYLKKIQDSLEKYGIEQIDSPEIKKVLNHYYNEKENFKRFSEKAKKIWNNELDVPEFKVFKESIETNLPNRTLFDLQLLAAFHLAFSQNACNFSVPGAGKTSVVYAAYSYLKNLPEDHPKHVNKLLIIGPLSSFGDGKMNTKSALVEKSYLNDFQEVSPLMKERDIYLLSSQLKMCQNLL